MGGKNKSSRKSTTTSTLDPRIMGILEDNLTSSTQVTSTPFQAFTGQRFAGFNDVQQGVQQQLLNFGGTGSGLFNQASQAAGALAGYQPMQISGTSYGVQNARPVGAVNYTPAGVTEAGFQRAAAVNAGPVREAQAAQIDPSAVRDVAGGNPISREHIDAYMNPYISDVVQRTLADIERERRISESLTNAAARKAKAFGGSGAAVAASLNNEDFTRRKASTAAELYSRGFDTALQGAQSDAARGLQARLANQQRDMGIAQTNAGLANTVNLTNAGAHNQRTEFNAGLGQQRSLADQQAANTAALANAGAYNTASLADAQARLAAAQTTAGISRDLSLADAAAANSAAQFGAQTAFEAQRSNQQADQAAAQTRLQAGQFLSALSDQQRGQLMQDIQAAQSVGDARQQLEQSMLDFGFEQHEAERMWPLMLQELQNQAVGLFGNPVLTNSQSQESSSSGSLLGSLGSLASGLGSMGVALPFSDGRLKSDVETLGHDGKGRRWVSFRYHGDPVRRSGLIAQEVLRTDPHAVHRHPNGYLMVDYGALEQ